PLSQLRSAFRARTLSLLAFVATSPPSGGFAARGESLRMLKGEERSAEGGRNGPVDHFERRTPRAWASDRTEGAGGGRCRNESEKRQRTSAEPIRVATEGGNKSKLCTMRAI